MTHSFGHGPRQFAPGLAGQPETQWLICLLIVIGIAVAIGAGFAGSVPVDSSSAREGTLLPAAYKVNPNTASWPELAALPGIGPALAKRIVAYREERRAGQASLPGCVFRSCGDLEAVRGIGPKRSAALADSLAFPREAQRD